LLLDKTNFYAEAGGQEYDTGLISIDGEAEFEVTDVQAFNGYVLHIGTLKEGELKVGDNVICTYDEVSLQWSLFTRSVCSKLSPQPASSMAAAQQSHRHPHPQLLSREVLGDHIDQKGSLVAPTKLRFASISRTNRVSRLTN
jgi:alanyl-tRNA synthetase